MINVHRAPGANFVLLFKDYGVSLSPLDLSQVTGNSGGTPVAIRLVDVSNNFFTPFVGTNET